MKKRPIEAHSLELPPEVVSSIGLMELNKLSSDDITVDDSAKLVLLSGQGKRKNPDITIYVDDVREALSGFDFSFPSSPVLHPTPHPQPSSSSDGAPAGTGGTGSVESEPPETYQVQTSVQRFIGYFVLEIRKIICKNTPSSRTLGHTTTGALAALGAWIVESFGVSSHTAMAVAAAVLVAVSSAAKGAFCKMTEEQARFVFPAPRETRVTPTHKKADEVTVRTRRPIKRGK